MPAAMERIAGETVDEGSSEFDCVRCGKFRITDGAENILVTTPPSLLKVAKVSGYIRKNEGLEIGKEDILAFATLPTVTVKDKAIRLLMTFASQYPQPGAHIPNPAAMVRGILERLEVPTRGTYDRFAGLWEQNILWLKWLAIASAADSRELEWLIEEALIGPGFVVHGKSQLKMDSRDIPYLIITPEGWREVDRLRQVNQESALGFVAMSFHADLIELYDQAIAPGIRFAGFEAVRVDRKEHNNRIDDEIIATIKSSRFLIADFSIERGGIYFESGYALGLGLPVIWMVRDDQLHAVHFDTRQYNFIRWKSGNWTDLQRALKNRIEATIGRGPLRMNQPS